MLTTPDLLSFVSKLLAVCVNFSNAIRRLTRSSKTQREAATKIGELSTSKASASSTGAELMMKGNDDCFFWISSFRLQRKLVIISHNTISIISMTSLAFLVLVSFIHLIIFYMPSSNKTGTSKIGAISKAQKAQSFLNMPRTYLWKALKTASRHPKGPFMLDNIVNKKLFYEGKTSYFSSESVA